MNDPLPRNYDAWRTRNAEDEDDERAAERLRDERRMDKAEHDAERKQDGE